MPTLPVEVWQRIQPKAFYQSFLPNNIRPDGRKLDEYRNFKLRRGVVASVDGSAMVELGKSSVIVGVEGKVKSCKESLGGIQQTKDELFSKLVNVQIELTPLCHRDFRMGRISEEALEMKDWLERVIELVIKDKSTLCIVEDKYYWCLQVTAYCISCDGNIMETTLLAAYGALLDTSLPPLISDGENNQLKIAQDKSNQSLSLKNITDWPFLVNIGIFGQYCLFDLTIQEEQLMDIIVMIWNNDKGDKLAIQKHKNGLLSENLLKKLLKLATFHIHERMEWFHRNHSILSKKE